LRTWHEAKLPEQPFDEEMMAEDILKTDVQNKVALLTFNRPDRMNALSRDLIFSAIEVLTEWSNDPQVGVIVVTGEGRAFSAGGDITNMAAAADQTLEERVDGMRRAHNLSWMLYNIPKVTIAAANGFAMGAGLGVCLSCDLRYASNKAKFGTAFAKVGYSGDFGTTWLLTRYAGAPKAKEMLILGDIIEAHEAERLGLINRVFDHEELMPGVMEIAGRLAHGPLTSFRYMKSNVNMATTSDFRALLDREAETQSRCGMTEDHKEGVRAFLEKRDPQFTGR
jgi:2-(1,2-epoxy-1,2-dihydrophenyl)acetyl-CoA isomerase